MIVCSPASFDAELPLQLTQHDQCGYDPKEKIDLFLWNPTFCVKREPIAHCLWYRFLFITILVQL